MKALRPNLLAAAAAVMPLVAAAQNPPVAFETVKPASRLAIYVSNIVMPEVTKLLEPAAALKLFLVAEQAAAAVSCPDYAIDSARFGAVMGRLLEPVRALTDPSAHNLPLDMVINAYSVVKGGALARAAYDTEAFCADAAGLFEELSEHDAEKPDDALLVLARKG